MSAEASSVLLRQFEANRRRLCSMAYRMLGSQSEAEDVVQEAWLRLSRTDTRDIGNLGGWLTTVVARVSLDLLRARRSGGGDDAVSARFPDPVIEEENADPERDAIQMESVSLALLVVLETLDPAERLAFVLHDTFDVPFERIAEILDKTPAAVRQLASRARRRIQRTATPPDADMGAQREVVAAFLEAARGGDFDALLRVLDPEVVVRFDLGTGLREVRGAESAAKNALIGAQLSASVRPMVVNGEPGVLSFDQNGEPRSLLAFTIRRGKITEIHGIADPARLRRLPASAR